MTPDQQLDDMRNAVQRAFEALGFRLEHTGGNCTAFVRRYPDGSSHYVTVEGDALAPEDFSDRVGVGFYNPADEYQEEGNGGRRAHPDDLPDLGDLLADEPAEAYSTVSEFLDFVRTDTHPTQSFPPLTK